MSDTITGVVTNGVIIPNSPLPEGAHVEIQLAAIREAGLAEAPSRRTPGELRRMPREQRQAILAEASAMAEQDYHTDKELTGFVAYSEEERDDDESESTPG
jgi:hypothetical protein